MVERLECGKRARDLFNQDAVELVSGAVPNTQDRTADKESGVGRGAEQVFFRIVSIKSELQAVR